MFGMIIGMNIWRPSPDVSAGSILKRGLKSLILDLYYAAR